MTPPTLSCVRLSVELLLARELTLRLFVNDHKPGRRDTPALYREASGYGYAPIPLHPEQWKISETDEQVRAAYPWQSFVFDGRLGSVWGYYVTHGDKVLWAQRFTDPPHIVKNDGDRIEVEPVYVLR